VPDRYAQRMSARPSLSLAEWTVLGVLSQQPAHGFAVAQLTAPGGQLGRIWHIPRPVVYRSIGRLAAAGLVTPESTEPGQGPQRTIYAATPHGRQAFERWLDTPVQHVREIRSHLLLKLALLDRAGRDPTGLLRRQRAVLEPIALAIEAGSPPRTGFDATLDVWRRVTATAALDFLDTVTRDQPATRPR
jgi:DNA-binding PadR family transcriptional regulator